MSVFEFTGTTVIEQNNITPTGGTLIAVLNDASDATYAQFASSAASTSILRQHIIDMSSIANTRIESVQFVVRVAANSPSTSITTELFDGVASVPLGTQSMATGGAAATFIPGGAKYVNGSGTEWTYTNAAALYWAIVNGSMTSIFRAARLHVLWTVIYKPSTTGVGVTGQLTSRTPLISWTHVENDPNTSVAQYARQVKVFTDAQVAAGGFNPETSTPVWDSGQVNTATLNATVGVPLDDDDYFAYVRTGVQFKGGSAGGTPVAYWSDWVASAEFTISLDTPLETDRYFTPHVFASEEVADLIEVNNNFFEVARYSERVGGVGIAPKSTVSANATSNILAAYPLPELPVVDAQLHGILWSILRIDTMTGVSNAAFTFGANGDRATSSTAVTFDALRSEPFTAVAGRVYFFAHKVPFVHDGIKFLVAGIQRPDTTGTVTATYLGGVFFPFDRDEWNPQ